jgi:large subunit ribosomal protein L5
MPRLKLRYRGQVVAKLQEELRLANPMQVPRLEKAVINIGVGDALKDGRMLEAAVADLEIITGQKVVVTKRGSRSPASSSARASRSARRSRSAGTGCGSSSTAS